MQEARDERLRKLACIGVPRRRMGERAKAVGSHDGRMAGWLFKSGFEIPVHGDKTVVAESGAWCNDLESRCNKGELR